jgi:3'-phosphoadenosine 5'-phosphosulfate sulfotransferase (PAPS reductase)/FAD synthetase
MTPRVLKKIKELISKGALFVLNDSGGKDSQAMKIFLLHLVPHDQLVIVHANLPEVEWDGNMEHIKRYSEDVPVFEVQAGKTFFEMVDHRGMFPSASCRQCTSDLKRGPIQKFIRHYAKDNGFQYVVNCLGIRAEESSARAKKKIFRFNKKDSAKHRTQFEWLPILRMKIGWVFMTITAAGQELHYAYKEGMSRLSCCFCILASDKDLSTAARLKPQLAWRYIKKEEELNFTLSMSRRPLKEIIGF